MAEVIGYDEKAYKTVMCRKCAAINKYTEREVKSVHGTDYGGGPDGMEYILCANCGGNAIIKSW